MQLNLCHYEYLRLQKAFQWSQLDIFCAICCDDSQGFSTVFHGWVVYILVFYSKFDINSHRNPYLHILPVFFLLKYANMKSYHKVIITLSKVFIVQALLNRVFKKGAWQDVMFGKRVLHWFLWSYSFLDQKDGKKEKPGRTGPLTGTTPATTKGELFISHFVMYLTWFVSLFI